MRRISKISFLKSLILFVFFMIAGQVIAGDGKFIRWDDLVPSVEPYDDPFLDMTYEQKSDLRDILKFQSLKEQDQSDEEVSKAADEARMRLEAQGLDADWLLRQRLIVMDRRQEAATGVAVEAGLLNTTITLDGYVLPLDVSNGKVVEFLLVPWVGACIHTPPPAPNQIVHVSMPEGLSVEKRFDAFRLTGVLRHEPASHELFLVDGTRYIDISYSLSGAFVSGQPGEIVAASMDELRFLDRAQVWTNSLFTQAMTSMEKEGLSGALLIAIVLSFGYGALHTLGPGHGKAVVISYFVGTGGSLRRGLVMGVRIAIIHVLSAVVVVFLLDFAVRQTTGAAPSDYRAIRLASYSLIIAIGAFMLWRAVSDICMSARAKAGAPLPSDHGEHSVPHDHKQGHVHKHHMHGCAACAAHASPAGSGWIATAVGIVPCTGALIVMLFGLANDEILPAIMMVCAISAGMAVAMTAIGMAAIWGRNWAESRFKMNKDRQQKFELSTRFVGALCVFSLGVVLFWATYTHSLAVTIPQGELVSRNDFSPDPEG